jgi:bifunctional NMN adenylyltransferase/nudix hydrolase
MWQDKGTSPAPNDKYDILIYIGRFSPFHLGHRRVVQLALEKASQVLILVGSAFQSRTIKNPFTFEEREQMILQSLEPQNIPNVTIRPLRDFPYNNQQWISQVQTHVGLLNSTLTKPGMKIGIIGYEKDASSWYVHSFPQYDFIDVGCDYDHTIDATTIRRMWLSGQSPRFTDGALRRDVHEFIYNKFPKKERERLARELEIIDQTQQEWKGTPYPVNFVTTDAVVIQSGHVLVVKRKSAPGEGLIAIPGGYLNVGESVEDGTIRELREETKIKVPEPVLRGSIKARHVFDDPGRSLRGRIITHASLIELPPGDLPKVKGSDDAAKAFWLPLSEFEKMEDQFFEDHHHIIKNMLGRV